MGSCHWQTFLSSLYPDLKPLLFDLELGELRAAHKVDELFNLFQVQV